MYVCVCMSVSMNVCVPQRLEEVGGLSELQLLVTGVGTCLFLGKNYDQSIL